MTLVLAFIVVGMTLALAKRGFLHPGDYLVEAALALHVLVFAFVITPTALEHAELLARGAAPAQAIARSAYLLANGLSIEAASVVVAIGACLAAAQRGKAFGGWHPVEARG
ncbi:MAG: hypothetical protein ABI880_11060 [Acidobacteriota bacterium]